MKAHLFTIQLYTRTVHIIPTYINTSFEKLNEQSFNTSLDQK